ncbi:hypothetical protein A3C37_05580 [Candidatus Peribacteria bacterium RIFCSPHIGHO2_02_FULL_53_20]|nr:MAG: hypothetical protein A3C37_05580 [Candidatus Peribacteria bacterium RIFCSPHIGHO2_02_FULL_53_20]OGJ73864.1 MAG: hypothetical protein A3G69_04290 [Candidatus Peribacteria bacterium RIFCSPLOWO2_12_FULL_53_10]
MHASPSNGEQLIRIANEHWIKYVMPIFVFLILIAVSLLLFFLAGMSAYHVMWISHIAFIPAVLLMLVAHHWFFVMVLSEVADCIIVTDKRLIQLKIRLLQHDAMVEVSFEKMKMVEASKVGLLQNILNYGTLHFEGAKAAIKLVPHPNSVARDIEQAMGRM